MHDVAAVAHVRVHLVAVGRLRHVVGEHASEHGARARRRVVDAARRHEVDQVEQHVRPGPVRETHPLRVGVVVAQPKTRTHLLDHARETILDDVRAEDVVDHL